MRKKTRSRFLLLVAFLLCALMLWLFWNDLEKLVGSGGKKTLPERTPNLPKEKISDEERKGLEEILKRR